MKNNLLKGHLAILFANILFGLNMPNVKEILMQGEVGVFALNYARLAGGAAFLWLASLFFPKEKVAPKDLLLLLPASIMGVQLNQLSFIYASQYSSPVDLSVIATLVPIITMLLAALFLKEPITFKKVSGVVMGAAGILIIVLGTASKNVNATNPTKGNLIFLFSIIFFATYLTLFRPLITRYRPITFMKWMFLFAAICQAPLCYKDVLAIDYASLSSNSIWGVVFAAVGASFLSYMLLGFGQKILRPTVISMYNYMQPFTVFVVALMFRTETLHWTKILAAFLVFTGVYIVNQSKAKS